MTDPLAASGVATPKHVWVYGNDHSPWVQAVLLGLRERDLDHTLVTVPPVSVFLRSGVLMPAAKIDDGPWMLDSEKILVALGFSEVPEDERRALQMIFGSGALRRADDPWEFWRRFSLVRDGRPARARRLWNQFWRTFSMFYFFALITIARRRVPRRTPEQLRQEFSSWQERLAPSADFLGGDAPDTLDLQLFGLVQMLASIPGPSLAVLRDDPTLERLRGWVAAMQRRFSDFNRLYSAPHFQPELPPVEPAPTTERIAYWCGTALMWISFPITLATTLYFVRRVRRLGLQRP